MNRKETDILALRHYSRLRPINCNIVSGSTDSFFTVKINDPIDVDIRKGDPVTFGKLENESNTKILGGSIISASSNNLVISSDSNKCEIERRKNERYPVSIYGNIKFGPKKQITTTIWVKDISCDGLRILTDAKLGLNEDIEIDLFNQNNLLNLECKVVRKSSLYDRNEYGLQIKFRDKNAIFSLREYLDILIKNEKRIIKNLLSFNDG